MIRSICLVQRDYPLDGTAARWSVRARSLARALARRGLAVHVIALDPRSEGRRILAEGVTVHRLAVSANPIAGCPEIGQSLWSQAVADFYTVLDGEVDFDAVLVPAAFSEGLKLEPSPRTAFAALTQGIELLRDPLALDARLDHSRAVVARMELTVLERTPLVLADCELDADRVAGFGERAVVVTPAVEFGEAPSLAAPSLAAPAFPGELSLCFVGPLSPEGGVSLAVRILAEVRQRGVDAHLALVGPDGRDARANSYRAEILEPLIAQLELPASSYHFVGDPGYDAALELVAASDGALLFSPVDTFEIAIAGALGRGVAVLGSPTSPLTTSFARDDGFAPLATDDLERSVVEGATLLTDASWRTSARKASTRARELFASDRAVDELLAALETAPREARLPAALRAPARTRPRLAVVVADRGDSASLERTLASVEHHTSLPVQVVVTDPTAPSSAAGRNVALTELGGDEDYVVFLETGTEVLARWWEPFVEVLGQRPDVGLVFEDAAAEPLRLGEVAFGEAAPSCCVVVSPSLIRSAGRFDEDPALAGREIEELASRGARLGIAAVRVGSGRVIAHGHERDARRASAPGSAAANGVTRQAALERKLDRRRTTSTSPVLLIASAQEVVADDTLLRSFAAAFEPGDDVALVALGVGTDPVAYELALRTVAEEAGFDLERGPRVLAILPPSAGDDDLRTLAEEVHVMFGTAPPRGPFSHLASFAPHEADQLRLLAARAWAVRPTEDADALSAVT